jgi:hypothetical protein
MIGAIDYVITSVCFCTYDTFFHETNVVCRTIMVVKNYFVYKHTKNSAHLFIKASMNI